MMGVIENYIFGIALHLTVYLKICRWEVGKIRYIQKVISIMYVQTNKL